MAETGGWLAGLRPPTWLLRLLACSWRPARTAREQPLRRRSFVAENGNNLHRPAGSVSFDSELTDSQPLLLSQVLADHDGRVAGTIGRTRDEGRKYLMWDWEEYILHVVARFSYVRIRVCLVSREGPSNRTTSGVRGVVGGMGG